MILSKNSLNKVSAVFFVSLACFAGCAHTRATEINTDSSSGKLTIAVLPLENLSGQTAPLRAIRLSLIESLRMQGFSVLDDKVLEEFMARHRVRYTGGIDSATAKSFKEEAKVDAALFTSLELYSESSSPKISIISRLVATGDSPAILWIDSVGLAGDDSPGILGIGLIEDMNTLQKKALRILSGSLGEYLSDNSGMIHAKTAGKRFRSRVFYKSPFIIDPEKKYRVAVVPFINKSERKNAGEILAMHFVRDLTRTENFDVIEPGIIRQKLLEMRVIMQEGTSLSDADLICSSLDADLLLTGKVMDYQDYMISWGKPKINFSALVIERGRKKVVWSSWSYNTGDDGVFFFDRGKINTANALASGMIQAVVEKMVKNGE